MEDQILIKKDNGKTFSVTAQLGDEGIIITKTGDKTDEAHKRKMIFEPMDAKIYKKFIETEIEAKPIRFVTLVRKLFK
jgi:hypothetical protein